MTSKSCVGAREDAGEALTEGDVGWVIEPRNHRFGVPTPFQWSEGNIAGRAIASCQRTPRGQRACACVESPSARTGRSRGCPAGCCLLYTSDAADEEDSVDLGGRRIIKK